MRVVHSRARSVRLKPDTTSMSCGSRAISCSLGASRELPAREVGGIPGKRQRVALPGLTDCDYFHRFNMSFSAGEGKLVATKGREIDHLGFDVKKLDDFEKRLVAQGLKFEAPPRQVANTQTRVAFLTDPWGTYIEVTERLAP